MANINLKDLKNKGAKAKASARDIMLVSIKHDKNSAIALRGQYNVVDVELVQSFLNQLITQAKDRGIKIRVYNETAMDILNYHLTKKIGKNRIILDNANMFESVFVNETFAEQELALVTQDLAEVNKDLSLETAPKEETKPKSASKSK